MRVVFPLLLLTPSTVVWLAYLISTIGERLSYVALLVLAASLSGTKIGTALVMSIYTLGFVLISPYAGEIIDTYANKKKTILIICDAARAIVVLSYVQALFFGQKQFSCVALYLSILIVVMISGVARPSMWAFIPETTDSDRLGKMNVLMSASADIAMALGTAAGGFLLARTGFMTIFAIDSFTYLVSATLLATLVASQKNPRDLRPAHASPRVDQGFIKDVLLVTSLRQSLILAAINNVLIGFLNYYLVLSVEKVFHLPSSFIAYGYTFWALGGLVALLLYPHAMRIAPSNIAGVRVLTAAGALLAIPSLLARNHHVFYPLIIALGMIYSLISARINSLCMQTCPPSMTGRFGALLNLVIRFSLLTGLWLGPMLVERTSAVVSGSLLVALYAFASYLSSSTRESALSYSE